MDISTFCKLYRLKTQKIYDGLEQTDAISNIVLKFALSI